MLVTIAIIKDESYVVGFAPYGTLPEIGDWSPFEVEYRVADYDSVSGTFTTLDTEHEFRMS